MTRQKILEEAVIQVTGKRAEDYGTPEDNFTNIAALWQAYTGHFYTPKDVAMMMCLMKIARIKAGTKEDSYIDLAGYAACAGEINTTKEKGV
jgi:hypothetical protein